MVEDNLLVKGTEYTRGAGEGAPRKHKYPTGRHWVVEDELMAKKT